MGTHGDKELFPPLCRYYSSGYVYSRGFPFMILMYVPVLPSKAYVSPLRCHGRMCFSISHIGKESFASQTLLVYIYIYILL